MTPEAPLPRWAGGPQKSGQDISARPAVEKVTEKVRGEVKHQEQSGIGQAHKRKAGCRHKKDPKKKEKRKPQEEKKIKIK